MLEVQVRKELGSFTLDVAFQAPGRITALWGPSGAGKSLTLKAIAGVMPVDAGRILRDAEALYDSEKGIDVPPQDRGVGYLPQSYALFPHLTVAGNIGFGLNRDGPETRERIAEMVERMDLSGLEARRPHQLSGGQQQRVALARALVLRPRLVLLDEPFAALDSAIRGEVRTMVAELPGRFDCLVLIVTHDPEDAAIAGDAFTIDRGRVTA